MNLDCHKDPDWLDKAVQSLDGPGYSIVENVLSPELVKETENRLYQVFEKSQQDIGDPEEGTLRIMFAYDPHFLFFSTIPQILEVTDRVIGPHAILHAQTGIISRPCIGPFREVHRFRFHKDFPRVLNGYRCSVNCFLVISDFEENNGATLLVPGSQQSTATPNPEVLRSQAVKAIAPKGSMIVFDSTLWHAGGQNSSACDRLGINHLFTYPYFKQQFDYCRALDTSFMETLPERCKALLGYYSRPPTSIKEYYLPAEKRLYRKGQG